VFFSFFASNLLAAWTVTYLETQEYCWDIGQGYCTIQDYYMTRDFDNRWQAEDFILDNIVDDNIRCFNLLWTDPGPIVLDDSASSQQLYENN